MCQCIRYINTGLSDNFYGYLAFEFITGPPDICESSIAEFFKKLKFHSRKYCAGFDGANARDKQSL